MNRKPNDGSRYGNCYWCIMCWLSLYSREELGETYNVKPDNSFQNTSRFLTINASTHIKQCRYWFDQAYWDLIQAQRGTGSTLIFYSVIHIGHERQTVSECTRKVAALTPTASKISKCQILFFYCLLTFEIVSHRFQFSFCPRGWK